MQAFMRKIRGLLGVGLTWGGLWSAIGAGIGLVVGVLAPEAWDLTNPIARWAIGLGLYGLVAGVAFGALLALREGRGSVFGIPLGRAAVWGVIGAAAVPLLFGALGMFEVGTTTTDVLASMLVTASLGGCFAPAAIAVARRAELREEPRLRLRAALHATSTSPPSPRP